MDWEALLAQLLAGEITLEQFMEHVNGASDDELEAARSLLANEFDRIRAEQRENGVSAESSAQLAQIVEAAEQAAQVSATRENEAAEREAAAEELERRMAAANGTDDAEGEGDDDAEGSEAGDGEGDGADGGDGGEGDGGDEGGDGGGDDEGAGDGGEGAGAEGGQQREPVNAAGTRPRPVTRGQLANRGRRGGSGRPAPVNAGRGVLVAAGDIGGPFHANQELEGMADVASALTVRHDAFINSRPNGERVYVARHEYAVPESRILTNDLESDEARIRAVVAAGQRTPDTDEARALLAAGGWCGPEQIYYNVDVLGERGRPARASLPQFALQRGKVRWNPAPQLEDLPVEFGTTGIGRWTAQNDVDALDPDGPRKSCVRFTCLPEDSAELEALYRCFIFGNLETRANPEQVRAWTDLALVWYDRWADQAIIQAMIDGSTAVDVPAAFSAVTDLLAAIGTAAVGYRSRRRLPDSFRFRVQLPAWIIDLLLIDVIRRQPGDDALEVTRQQVSGWFDKFGVNVSYFGDHQVFGLQPDGQLLDFPTEATWLLYPEGTWLLGTGGTLDIGIVRDMGLISTNDYAVFFEEFETVFSMGQDSLAVTSELRPNGVTSGPVADLPAMPDFEGALAS